ncbi:MAG: glycerol-3-phosphate dehydrogenase [Henriciella sp.]|nr:glycerol-3-phosphate dehydrogenase [Henriciella sp.]
MRLDHMYDILIIGGGINGAGIARDAAGRGLKVLLCEKDDLASHTSSASTKLIHGGLRYLEHYDFSLVRKALMEREVLLRAAPHIIWPLRFVLPHHKELRPSWLIRLGLFLYDHLGGRKLLPATKTLSRQNSNVFAPLQDKFSKGFEYSDCWVEDARLVVLNAMDAAERGATVLTQTECTQLDTTNGTWRARLRRADGSETQIEAKTVINAAGPWVDQVAARSGIKTNAPQVRLVKGSHIIVPKMFDDERCFIFQAGDGRVIFAIPYEDGRLTLIGTTDLPFDQDLDAVKASQDEIEYLCEVSNTYFKKSIKPDDVVSTYSGVRPLFDDQAEDASSVTRDYALKLQKTNDAPILSVIGGKITTYRKLAEDALKHLSETFPTAQMRWTETAPLPGGDIDDADFTAFASKCAEQYPWLKSEMRDRLARTYGTRIGIVLKDAKQASDLGHDYGGGLTQKEVDYLIANEFARTADDILFRRTKLGLHLSSTEQNTLKYWFSNASIADTKAPETRSEGTQS